MRKFLFFLLLLPAIASVGHDAYMYYQEPDHGFRLSDLGALWDKYHKESHDQWKTNIQELSKNVNEILPDKTIPESVENVIRGHFLHKEKNLVANKKRIVDNTSDKTTNKTSDDFSEGFIQNIYKDGKVEIKPFTLKDEEKDILNRETRTIISVVGFVLEQKAVLVLGSIPVFFFVLNFVFSAIFRKKEEMDKINGIKKKKRKGGGYKYTRK